METQSTAERGLLDLSVALSTRDITAGKQFSLFVLVKNPFDKPVWVSQVNLSLPSELKLAKPEESKRDRTNKTVSAASSETATNRKKKQEENLKLQEELGLLRNKLSTLKNNLRLDALDANEIENLKNLINQIFELEDKIQELNSIGKNVANIHVSGGFIQNAKIATRKANIHVSNQSDSRQNPFIENLEIYDPETYEKFFTRSRTIELLSSLPKNASLQPGSTAVYTAVLYVESSLIFTPSQYRLQFNVNYRFEPPKITNAENEEADFDEHIFTNTISHELSIRPSVYSVIYGAIAGGFAGSVARLLQLSSASAYVFSVENIVSSLVTIALTIILSGVSIIFMARKSDTQSFVSVEDFWGGLLIGFLVGYTGTSFFEQLTGVANPAANIPNVQ